MPHQRFQRFELDRVIMFFSIFYLRETTFTISVSTGEPVSVESEIVRVVSLSKTEISNITRLKKSDLQGSIP